jgi:Cu/Zn superoxide dismutase
MNEAAARRSVRVPRILLAVAVALAGAVVLIAPSAEAAVNRGTLTTTSAGAALGYDVSGTVRIVRSGNRTVVTAVVRGLEPGATYAAHLHNLPCGNTGPGGPGGGHYAHDPQGPPRPPNELWLSSTPDPMAGITANRRGVGTGRGSAPWVARPEAQAVVIHAIPPGGSTAGGPKIACADLA